MTGGDSLPDPLVTVNRWHEKVTPFTLSDLSGILCIHRSPLAYVLVLVLLDPPRIRIGRIAETIADKVEGQNRHDDKDGRYKKPGS